MTAAVTCPASTEVPATRPSTVSASSSSKRLVAAWLKKAESERPAATRTARLHAAGQYDQAADEGARPRARARSRLARLALQGDEAIAQPTHGLDPFGADLAPHAADEDFDGVGIPVEILIVEVLDQLGPADHPALVHDQVVQQPIFE